MSAKKKKIVRKKTTKTTAAKPTRAIMGRKKIGKPLLVIFPPDLRTRLQAIAEPQGISDSEIVRRACQNFVRQIELGEDLAAIEEKIAATLSQTDKLVNETNKVAWRTWTDAQTTLAVLDFLVQFVLISTPEQPDKILKEAAELRGQTLYNDFLKNMPSLFVKGGRAAKVGVHMRRTADLAPDQDELARP